MADVITETTSKSYLNRVGGSFGGVILGLVFGTLTIALAWLFYRSLVSPALITGAALIAWGIKVAILDKRKPQIDPQSTLSPVVTPVMQQPSQDTQPPQTPPSPPVA